MPQSWTKWAAGSVMAALLSGAALGALPMAPVNGLPNPYEANANWFKLPDGRKWGSTAGVDIAPDGKSVWAVDRCGGNGCVDSKLNPIMKFDANGNLVAQFGAGQFAFPHGIHVDKDENVWVTDSVLAGERGAGALAKGLGQIVRKFDKTGKVLLTLGTPGVSGKDATHFNAPSDVAIAPNGDIFVADGHANGTNERIVKFDKTGKFIKEWGHPGSGPGAFSTTHGIEIDSRGRVFVANRDNNRIDIFDQDGKMLESWEQFSRPAGIGFNSAGQIVVCDSESGGVSETHQDWTRGIRVGTVADGKVQYLIPDPDKNPKGTSAAEGCAIDKDGVVYGAEVGPQRMMRYVKK